MDKPYIPLDHFLATLPDASVLFHALGPEISASTQGTALILRPLNTRPRPFFFRHVLGAPTSTLLCASWPEILFCQHLGQRTDSRSTRISTKAVSPPVCCSMIPGPKFWSASMQGMGRILSPLEYWAKAIFLAVFSGQLSVSWQQISVYRHARNGPLASVTFYPHYGKGSATPNSGRILHICG